MTIPVAADQLPETLSYFGSAILVTPRPDSWAHVLTVDPICQDGKLVIADMRPSRHDEIATDPRVSLVWPPIEHHGYTLVVDGLAASNGGDLVIEVDHAVLHRPRAHADGPAWQGPRADEG